MSYIEVPSKFTHVLPDGKSFTIDNDVRRAAGMLPIVKWPQESVWVFTKGEPDLGSFYPSIDKEKREYEDET